MKTETKEIIIIEEQDLIQLVEKKLGRKITPAHMFFSNSEKHVEIEVTE